MNKKKALVIAAVACRMAIVGRQERRNYYV